MLSQWSLALTNNPLSTFLICMAIQLIGMSIWGLYILKRYTGERGTVPRYIRNSKVVNSLLVMLITLVIGCTICLFIIQLSYIQPLP